ncbi:MAG: AbrB/MazE/SpoVT family DNA-binding domain-containing protein [Lachnospiraceae bacterium]|jgi:AbrB family transcriptional regulator (stage V sporulation protein T)|nr:AbrB/MazE/SpoVT family DNA-binding domain-containing protein [Lachnospiraceae bacterium]
MKATGVVRKIDDLGRIVIPKEIRKTMRVREGEPLEIFTDRNGQIILKKYSPIGDMGGFAKHYAESLAQSSGYTVCISDKDMVVAASGQGKKKLQDKDISNELEKVMQQRELHLAQSGEKGYIPITEEGDQYASQVIMPIISEGNPIGAVAMLGEHPMAESDKKLVMVAAGFLGRQMEE